MTTDLTIDETKVAEFSEQILGVLGACYGGAMISLGDKLGLYEALAGAGPLTSEQVAERSGCAERYVREWLGNQVASGCVAYDPEARTYELPPEHAAVLADREGLAFMPPAFEVAATMWLDEEKALRAFRSGEGVAWGDHDERLFCGVAAFFRNGYRASLVPEWLPALQGVEARLQSGARVLDVGCGYGHSSILMAEAFPRSSFVGVDSHEASIAAARQNAAAAGVAERVEFVTGTATGLGEAEFDLICFFDCLHDMGDPLGALIEARTVLADGGTVMLVEPFAGDSVEENANPVGQLYYAASTVLCCAHALSEEGGYALGAQAGEARLAALAEEAGFSHWRRAAEGPFNLVFEARV